MSEAFVTVLFIAFFAITGFKDIQTKTPLGLLRGAVCILIAVAFIYGSVTRF